MNPLIKKIIPNLYEIKMQNYFCRFVCLVCTQKSEDSHRTCRNLNSLCSPDLLLLHSPMLIDGNSPCLLTKHI